MNNAQTPNQQNGTNAGGVNSVNQQTSVGQPHKELGPMPQVEPIIKEKSDHVELSQETESVGMRVHQDQIQVAKELQNIGIYETGTSAKVPAHPTVKLPIPDTEIERGLHAKMYHSIRWLAEWCIFQLKRAHMTLKVVRGRVLRVPYRNK